MRPYSIDKEIEELETLKASLVNQNAKLEMKYKKLDVKIMKEHEEKRKVQNLKYTVNDILDNQWKQLGYDEKEALTCLIMFAKQRLEDLGTL